MATLGEIETAAKKYSTDFDTLTDLMRDMEAEINETKKLYLKQIKKLLDAAKASRSVLHTAIEGSPELFQKPRTFTFHGIKVGFKKAKGKLIIESDEQTVKLIRKHFKDRFDELVITKETPAKKVLEKMPATDLKKLAVQVQADSDEVVLNSTDSEIEKMVGALFKDDDQDQTKAA